MDDKALNQKDLVLSCIPAWDTAQQRNLVTLVLQNATGKQGAGQTSV